MMISQADAVVLQGVTRRLRQSSDLFIMTMGHTLGDLFNMAISVGKVDTPTYDACIEIKDTQIDQFKQWCLDREINISMPYAGTASELTLFTLSDSKRCEAEIIRDWGHHYEPK